MSACPICEKIIFIGKCPHNRDTLADNVSEAFRGYVEFKDQIRSLQQELKEARALLQRALDCAEGDYVPSEDFEDKARAYFEKWKKKEGKV